MRQIVAISLQQRALVILLFIAFVAVGAYGFLKLNIEAYPDPVPPTVVPERWERVTASVQDTAVGLAMVGWLVAGLLGFMVALSSTALALKLFQDAGQSTGPGARLALGIALFQDVAVIAAIIVMPALFHAGGSGAVLPALGSAVGRGILFCGGAWLVTRYGIPRLLALVTATRSRELFTITVIGLCAGIASSAYAMGLSLALGAFVAGLVVSESVYSHRILADVLPFRDLFLALFFISIGLLIRIEVFLAHWWFYLVLAAVVYAGKVAIVFLAARWVRRCVPASRRRLPWAASGNSRWSCSTRGCRWVCSMPGTSSCS